MCRITLEASKGGGEGFKLATITLVRQVLCKGTILDHLFLTQTCINPLGVILAHFGAPEYYMGVRGTSHTCTEYRNNW